MNLYYTLAILAYVVFGIGYIANKTNPKGNIEHILCVIFAPFWPVAFVARLGWLLEEYTNK